MVAKAGLSNGLEVVVVVVVAEVVAAAVVLVQPVGVIGQARLQGRLTSMACLFHCIQPTKWRFRASTLNG